MPRKPPHEPHMGDWYADPPHVVRSGAILDGADYAIERFSTFGIPLRADDRLHTARALIRSIQEGTDRLDATGALHPCIRHRERTTVGRRIEAIVLALSLLRHAVSGLARRQRRMRIQILRECRRRQRNFLRVHRSFECIFAIVL